MCPDATSTPLVVLTRSSVSLLLLYVISVKVKFNILYSFVRTEGDNILKRSAK